MTRRRLGLLPLEDRTAPAVHTWVGGGVTVNVAVDGGAPALLRSEAQIAQMLARAVSLGARRM